MRLFGDLEAWEAGELSMEELERRHPEAGSLVALSERISADASRPVMPPPWGWERVESRLSERRRVASWRTRRARLAVASSLAAVVLGAAAYAGPDVARRGVASVLDRMTELFTDDTEPSPSPSPSPAVTPRVVRPTPSVAPPSGAPLIGGAASAEPQVTPSGSPAPTDEGETPEPSATPKEGNEGAGVDETPHPDGEGSAESTATPHPDEGGD